MKKEKQEFNDEDTMREEYDFDYSKAVWGKHAKRYQEEGTNVILLDADVYNVFPDSAAVNAALRSMIEVSQITDRLKIKPKRKAVKSSTANPSLRGTK